MDEQLKSKVFFNFEKAITLGQELLRNARKLKQETKKVMRMRDELIRQKKEILNGYLELRNNTSEEYGREIDELREDISRRESEQEEEQKKYSLNEPVASALESLDQFDFEDLPESIRLDYISWLLGYSSLHNNHYVVESFVRIVKAGFNPPKWVILAVAEGFHQYLIDPTRDPKLLGKKLGLEGTTSGATNPWRERKQRSDRSLPMMDMGSLICHFGLSQNRAAKAVKIKYELSESVSTLKKYFSSYFIDSKKYITDANPAVALSDYERTKFGSSFPVQARKLFNK